MCKQFVTKRKNTWISPGHQGASHNSTTCSETQSLVESLDDIKDVLKHHKLFFVGDSAYPISPYLMVSYQNIEGNTVEDIFKYFLSNSHFHD